jgi:hypothetical protein
VATEADAYAALDRWREGHGYRAYGVDYNAVDDSADPDGAFVAGFEAGWDELRDRILRLWDDNDAWIPGGDYARLAAVLVVPPERTQTHRDKPPGLSKPSRLTVSPNIPIA